MKNIIFPGLRKFFEKTHSGHHYTHGHLAKGQQPKAMVIACSDSRISAPFAEVEPGNVFAVRNVANLIPPYKPGLMSYLETSSAIEYGVCALKVDHLIVKGHSHCGGINRALRNSIEKPKQLFEFVDPWVSQVEPLARVVYEEMQPKKSSFESEDKWFEEVARECERRSVVHSLENLLTYPWIKERYDAKTLLLHGWHFDIATGEIHFYDGNTKKWDNLMRVILKEEEQQHGDIISHPASGYEQDEYSWRRRVDLGEEQTSKKHATHTGSTVSEGIQGKHASHDCCWQTKVAAEVGDPHFMPSKL